VTDSSRRDGSEKAAQPKKIAGYKGFTMERKE